MNASFLKRQRTWVCILLAGLVIIITGAYFSGYRFKAENYLPLLKSNTYRDTLSSLNLGFETVSKPNGLPDGWMEWGYRSYDIQVDSLMKRSGKYALRLEPKREPSTREFGCLALAIPAIFEGENITLKAFMRTEGVDRPIGLMLRIDGNDGSLQFDNMMQRGLTGTPVWEEYSVTLPLPVEAKMIYIGALLMGKGQLWIDDIQLLIDGEDITEAKIKKPKTFKAELDTTFDNGSKIDIRAYTPEMVTSLELLGRIWGFLKYYHPAVAAGEYNWDAELFRIMPAVIDAQNTDERNKILADWIDRLGKVKPAKKASVIQEVKLKPDFTWMDKPELSKALSMKLKAIINAERGDYHYYFDLLPNENTPKFKNEKRYEKIDYYKDSGLRLLALYRYWNTVQYFYPYRYAFEKEWNDALHEFIPKFLDCYFVNDYKQTLLELIKITGDKIELINNLLSFDYSYSQIQTRAPFEIMLIDSMLVVKDYLDEQLGIKSGVRKGDVIVEINNKPVEEVIWPTVFESPFVGIGTSNIHLFGSQMMSVKVFREGKKLTFDIDCYPLDYKDFQLIKKPSHLFLSNETGYIRPDSLSDDSLSNIMASFLNTKGLIIDLRYFSVMDDTSFTLCSYLSPHPVDYVRFTRNDKSQPGTFSLMPTLKTGKENRDYYKGKVVVLVNDATCFKSETYAMALQACPNVTVIGSATSSIKHENSMFVVPGGLNIMMASAGMYYPDGRETHRVGVAVDMEVKPTIQGIINGRDELLEKAIEIIHQ